MRQGQPQLAERWLQSESTAWTEGRPNHGKDTEAWCQVLVPSSLWLGFPRRYQVLAPGAVLLGRIFHSLRLPLAAIQGRSFIGVPSLLC